ncbi:DUF2357 domain-containing protein [Planococcus sp. 107-1]|uniref:DUF2357 domain-containing protein n=1 Tax=Planococcus sp. 107-1 TaxID=2908840 RepID=UPI001F40ABBC|nr:DUF2357 domain-containing protein [Planococcus sp. 107-1]UJF26666.1 DUF2357 domain-containing protein [Planococcus sp. 107-1]
MIKDMEFLNTNNNWDSIDNLLLIEGKSYIVRVNKEYTLQASGLNIELDKKRPNVYKIIVPFKTGQSKVTLLKQNKKYKTFDMLIHSDNRKIIYEDYIQMMTDVVNCHNLSLTIDDENVELNKFKNTIDLDQFTAQESMFIFLQNFFEELLPSIKDICENPMKTREKSPKTFPIYRTDKLDASAINWISRNSEKCFNISDTTPTFFKTKVNNKSYDIFENLVIYNILNDLISLCTTVYKKHKYIKAKKMEQQLLQYLNRSHLKSLKTTDFNFRKTMKIKFNRNYSLIYDFYKKMKQISFRVNPVNFNLLSLPLSKTYKLYEIWTFLKVVNILERHNKIPGNFTIPISYNVKEECFDIVHGEKSCVNLNNGYKMYYQKHFDKGGVSFRTYTTTLIPDISFVKNDKVIVLDSKYRISENLDGALAELHKYRDGIVVTNDRSKAVSESYIVTPTYSSRLEVHNKVFHSKWNMGCIMLKPNNDFFLSEYIIETLFPNYFSFLKAIFLQKNFEVKGIYKKIDLPGVLLTRDLDMSIY